MTTGQPMQSELMLTGGRGVAVGKTMVGIGVLVGRGVGLEVAVGAGVHVGYGVYVGSGAAVGTGVHVGYGVYVGSGAAVGTGVHVGAAAVGGASGAPLLQASSSTRTTISSATALTWFDVWRMGNLLPPVG